MSVSKFVLKLRLYKDEQKFEIFCSSFESTRYRIPSNKLTFRTITVFSPKAPKNLLSVHFSIIALTFSSLILFAFAILVSYPSPCGFYGGLQSSLSFHKKEISTRQGQYLFLLNYNLLVKLSQHSSSQAKCSSEHFSHRLKASSSVEFTERFF